MQSHMEDAVPRGVASTSTDDTVDDGTALAHACRDAIQTRSRRTVARVMDGMFGRTDSAGQARDDPQTRCGRESRYNAEGPERLKDRPRSRRPAQLDAVRKAEIGLWREQGPEPEMPKQALGLMTPGPIKGRIEQRSPIVPSLETVRRPIRFAP